MAVMSKPAPNFYEFGPFRLDIVKRLLLRGGAVVQVPPKAFDALFALIENSDRVVDRDSNLNIGHSSLRERFAGSTRRSSS